MKRNILKNRALAGLIIGLLLTLTISLFSLTEALHGWHLKIADSLYTRNEPSDEIVIIAIDDTSVLFAPKGLGRFAQWSRENYVNLLNVIQKEDPKVVVFDLLFHTPTQQLPFEKIRLFKNELDENLANKEKLELYETFMDENSSTLKNIIDQALAEKFEEFDNIVLAFNSNNNNPTFPLISFSKNTKLGNTETKLDNDGILRKVSPFFYSEDKKRYYDDIAVATVKEYLGCLESTAKDITEDSFTIRSHTKGLKIPLEDGEMNVNFFADPFQYQMIPFVKVVNGNFDPGLFRDKIVLIGITEFQEIQDSVLTPKSNVAAMSGVEFRANEIQTILEGKFLTNQSRPSQILTVAGVAIALTILFNYLGIALSIILAIMSIVGYIFGAHFFYGRGLILNMVYPFMAIVLAYLASWVYKYFIADKKKREIKSAFGHYVSEKLVDEISKNPDMVKLGGEKRTVTVFFSDIKNSTQLSEKTEITAWVSQINEYFTVMEGVIKRLGGTIDKYEGDAIMGFWNAPITQEDHVVLGYIAALEMRKALRSLHQKWEQEGRPLLEFRIGINTGEAIVGNFGSVSRFDYTVMGDTVNTASRLESSANKTYGTSIIVAGFEDFAAPEKLAKVIMREIDTVLLPGKNAPVKLFELVCLAEEITPEIKDLLEIYSSGLAAYRTKDFASAIQSFQSLPDDLPSQVMLERCKKLQEGSDLGGLDEDMVFKI